MELAGSIRYIRATLLQARRGATSAHRWLLVALLVAMMLASGCVISPRRTVGGGATPTPSPGTTPTPTPGTAPETLYVSNSTTNSILRFNSASTTTGNLAPFVISGANTQLNSPHHLFIDATNDRLYVANQTAGSVLVWEAASTKSGNIAPSRSISGIATGLIAPVDVAVDVSKDLLYVVDGLDVLVYTGASTANGSPVFARDIHVGFSPGGMFLDAANDRLFLTDHNANAINVYNSASTLNLSVAPSRAIFGAATLLNQPTGVAVDSVGKLIVSNAGSSTISVWVNAAAVNGNVAPQFSIFGANTTLNAPDQIAVNKTTPVEIFVANSAAANIPVFSNLGATSGNIQPSRNIVGASTGLSNTGVRGVALDTTR